LARAAAQVANMNSTEAPNDMALISRAFIQGQTLRRTYTADGADVSPALQWNHAPAGTESFAVICRDVDAPGGTFIHWLVYNIPGTASSVPEGLPRQEKLNDGSIQGTNDFQVTGYSGPKPPPGKTHNYHFELYALDTMLPVEARVNAARLLELIQGHVLATAKLMGTYRR
jgi:Raf kinase inhibitor-like YbhB/YbcL family protein